MHNIIIEKPYKFIPPRKGTFWPNLFLKSGMLKWYLKRYEGIYSCRVEGIDHLKESLRQNKGVMLAPNHCRYADPIVMGFITQQIQKPLFAMASWHLFQQNWFVRWALQAVGAFSVYREGVDRQSLDAAVDILTHATRPLVLFPEGTVFRTNDYLQALLDGISFIARAAAKRQQKKENTADGVVIHPVAIKYVYQGDIDAAIEPVLDSIDKKLTWIRGFEGNPRQRIDRIVLGLLNLKEIEYFGESQQGTLIERQDRLINHLLRPLEQKWVGKTCDGAIVPRIKSIRAKIVPELIEGEITPETRKQHWKDLADVYLSQQVAAYPVDYLDSCPTDTRILETVERLEEDLTGKTRIHRPIQAVIRIDKPIDVPAERAPRGEEDPIMIELRERLCHMLKDMQTLANPYLS